MRSGGEGGGGAEGHGGGTDFRGASHGGASVSPGVLFIAFATEER